MRVLTIIPAFNEAENIASVIDELSRDFYESDILVVNDCSVDDTEIVVRSKGICYITQPFNMGYAAALQTGFKYARMHDYDYVVQFDGDGQHIASEARKLFEIANQTQCDIVIGSRFAGKTGYKNSFFRSIGTKLFSFLIKLFCHQRIYDPTSGLQVLNRRVFSQYSRMHSYPDYPDANLLIDGIKQGYIIKEQPVVMRLRTAGVSMHNGVFKPIKYMLLMGYSIMIILLKRLNKGK